MTAESPSRRDYHHGDLRQALLDAAVEHLRAATVESLAFRDLARAVGVSPGAPYHHFRDRGELFAVLAAEGFARLGAMMESVRTRLAGVGPGEIADEMTCEYLRFGRENWPFYKVMFRSENACAPYDALVEPSADCAFGGLLGFLAQSGVDEGAVLGRAVAVWSLLHGLLTLSVDGPMHRKLPPELVEPVACEGVRLLLGLPVRAGR